jgi:hypothetical protein
MGAVRLLGIQPLPQPLQQRAAIETGRCLDAVAVGQLA